MAEYQMIVMTNAVEGKDKEFNTWYDEVHLPDVLAVPGVVAARRFKILSEDAAWKYVAIYDFDCDDPHKVIADITSRAGTERMRMSDALSMEGAAMLPVAPLGSKRRK